MSATSMSPTMSLVIRYRLLIVIVGVTLLGVVSSDEFLTISSMQSIIDRATVVGLLSLGLTPVLVAGRIDLSIGSSMSLVAVATIGLQSTFGNVGAAVTAVLLGVALGAFNAVLVVVLRISSLVATFATLLGFASLALLLTDSQPVSSSSPRFGLPITRDLWTLLTPRSLVFLTLAVLMFVLLRYTAQGRNVYAVGSSESAARAAGINTNAYLVGVFVISGLFVGLAGAAQALSTATGSPLAGDRMLIPPITAVVIGGTRLEGGRGSALATLGGVLALGALTSVFEFHSVPTYTQSIYTGALFIVLITLDRIDTVGDLRQLVPARMRRRRPVDRSSGSPVPTSH